VGDTGFVGSNLVLHGVFTQTAHSINVSKMYYSQPDILIYAGVTGTKWYANSHPEKDIKVIESAILNIQKIRPQTLILISTVDVYDAVNGVNEDSKITVSNLCHYGRHRQMLESWVRKNIKNYYILRLPAIYGANLRKNFIYDIIHFVPQLLKKDFYKEIMKEIPIQNYYQMNQDGDYVLRHLSLAEYLYLRERFKSIQNNSLKFTNSKSMYQFYNLEWLWLDIHKILNYEIKEMNIVTEPILASEAFKYVYGKNFDCHYAPRICYNIQTKYAEIMGGYQNYLYSKDYVLKDIKKFVKGFGWREDNLRI